MQRYQSSHNGSNIKSMEESKNIVKSIESEQNLHSQPFESEVEAVPEDWIERALAAIRVREHVLAEVFGEERLEQDRTREAKEKFLEVYQRTIGTVTLACDQAGIARVTFYKWMKTDPHFRSALMELKDDRVSMVEDRLMKLIQMDDGPSIRFFLERMAPEYKAKGELEIVTGTRTFEDILYEQAKRAKAVREGTIVDAAPKQLSNG